MIKLYIPGRTDIIPLASQLGPRCPPLAPTFLSMRLAITAPPEYMAHRSGEDACAQREPLGKAMRRPAGQKVCMPLGTSGVHGQLRCTASKR